MCSPKQNKLKSLTHIAGQWTSLQTISNSHLLDNYTFNGTEKYEIRQSMVGRKKKKKVTKFFKCLKRLKNSLIGWVKKLAQFVSQSWRTNHEILLCIVKKHIKSMNGHRIKFTIFTNHMQTKNAKFFSELAEETVKTLFPCRWMNFAIFFW